jgi:hypothetical protein
LGLALVAKIVGDHGGVIEFDGAPRRTVVRMMLPVAPPDTLPDSPADTPLGEMAGAPVEAAEP